MVQRDNFTFCIIHPLRNKLRIRRVELDLGGKNIHKFSHSRNKKKISTIFPIRAIKKNGD